VDAVCEDVETSPLGPVEKALFRYLDRVNHRPWEVTLAMVEAAQAEGVTEEMLYDGVTVCAIFNFFNRWIDGTGVPPHPDGHYEQHVAKYGDLGYAP